MGQMGTMQENNSIMAERLIHVRKQAGLTQTAFSEKIGISPRAYKNYELALRDVPLAVVVEIHKQFEVDLNWLSTGRGVDSLSNAAEHVKKIVRGIKVFEQVSKKIIPIEKVESSAAFLFNQLAKGKEFSDSDIQEYFQSTN